MCDEKKEKKKKETGLGLSVKKDENFGEWYSQVVVNGELINYDGKIAGCYVLRPSAVSVWRTMKDFFEAEIEKMEVEEYKFPMFISDSNLQKEKDHLQDFAPEEGHTAFATKEEADAEVLQILELYRRIYEEFLAVPVVKGQKTEKETFPGADYTTSIEAFIPEAGRGIQGATSHSLGHNFAKPEMFDIKFQDAKGETKMVWQNSWGYSIRTIGVMVMVHGDDKGLVIPPRVAKYKAVVVPVPSKDAADVRGIFDACAATAKALENAGVKRVKIDLKDNYSPGWKYSRYELLGVPLRIEIGRNELAKQQVCCVRRDNNSKSYVKRDEGLAEEVKKLLDDIQQSMFDAAKKKRDACVQVVKTWDEFKAALAQKKMILAPWCDEEEVEKEIKERIKDEEGGTVKSLCTPFEQPELHEGTLCFATGKPAKKWTYWGRSF
ncbi:unnamed protein product [Linum tenue]|uniref:proline--tRNA ligase n=1 Tax=Linum tenue TaxID=586396 RepID=A0AAV0MUV6_9ROSI|nr:unnamed protein product [Linum tenue]